MSNAPNSYELRRRKADAMYHSGSWTREDRDAQVKEINAEEQAEIRALSNAMQQSRLNR